jgi:hypothetical protein
LETGAFHDMLGHNAGFAMPLAFVRWLLSALALLALLLPGFAVGAGPRTPPANYPTAQEAQKHCPDDLVVWLDLPTRTYYYRRQRWYGSTKSGAYVCRNEANKAGMRATRNAE